MNLTFRTITAAAALGATMSALPSHAAGRIDHATLIAVPHGTFRGVQFTRYEAMFEGITPNNRPYRVPCQIITASDPSKGSRLLLFDWLCPSTMFTALGQEQAIGRFTLTDEFLFGQGASFATVRCQLEAIGKRSPISVPSLPWSDGLLDTASEFITSAGDEFDIVRDYVIALRQDPIALSLLGQINRRAAFGYSASGGRLRGLLRSQMGEGLFDFSLIGGAGNGYFLPAGNTIGLSYAERAPLAGSGLEIDFNSETDVVALGGHKARHEGPNYRTYEFAGAAHVRDVDAAAFGLADPQAANPADWTPFVRALLIAGNNWCDGINPPPTMWLGAPNDSWLERDAKGNALVRFVGGLPIITSEYRLPEVAVGKNQYIPLDPSYDDGTFLGIFRMIAGSHVDLEHTFTSHTEYVDQITYHARGLQARGYLLEADADSIIQRAIQSDIGRP